MSLPTRNDLIEFRAKAFKDAIVEAMGRDDLAFFNNIVAEISQEQECDQQDVAAALAYLLQKDRPLQPPKEKPRKERRERDDRDEGRDSNRRDRNRDRDRDGEKEITSYEAKPLKDFPDVEMTRYKVNVGRKDNVKPGQIVGAIANEAEIDGDYIGNIEIYETFTTVDLPAGMPPELEQILKQARVCNRPLNLEVFKEKPPRDRKGGGKPGGRKPSNKSKKPHRGKGKPSGERGKPRGEKKRSNR